MVNLVYWKEIFNPLILLLYSERIVLGVCVVSKGLTIVIDSVPCGLLKSSNYCHIIFIYTVKQNDDTDNLPNLSEDKKS